MESYRALVVADMGYGAHSFAERRQRLMDKLKESTSLTNHAGNVGHADVAFETSPRFNCTPLVCSLLRVVRVSIMVLWSSVTELTLARSQKSCSWEHICAGAEDDGRPDRAILGKSFSRHDLVRRVYASCGLDCNPAYNDMDHCVQLVGFNTARVHSVMEGPANSWSANWCEVEFIRLPCGVNACSVASEAACFQSRQAEKSIHALSEGGLCWNEAPIITLMSSSFCLSVHQTCTHDIFTVAQVH